MTIRAIMMGAYNSEGAKGIIGGSDRMAAIKAVAEAAGGSVNFASFMRGPYDIIVDFNVPDANTMMGVMAAAQASGTFTFLWFTNASITHQWLLRLRKLLKPTCQRTHSHL